MPKTLTEKIAAFEQQIQDYDSELAEQSKALAEAESALEQVKAAKLNGAASAAIRLVEQNVEVAKRRMAEITEARAAAEAARVAAIERRDVGKVSDANKAMLDGIRKDLAGKVKAPAGYFIGLDFDSDGNVVYATVTRKARQPRGGAGRASGKRFQWTESPDLSKVSEWELSKLRPASVATSVDLDTVHETYNSLIEAVVPGFTKRFKIGGEAAPRAGKDILASMIRHAGGSYVEIEAQATTDEPEQPKDQPEGGQEKHGKGNRAKERQPATA